jgi:hypothetical protein
MANNYPKCPDCGAPMTSDGCQHDPDCPMWEDMGGWGPGDDGTADPEEIEYD